MSADLPLLVDCDTGWGSPLTIARTVREMSRAGVAAIHLEDQVDVKRCGHRPGKEVVSTDQMVDRLRAAVDARPDEGLVIMARTDAAAMEGLDAAIERACRYVEAGADMIFAEALRELDQFATFAAAVPVPVLANMTEFGQTPYFTSRPVAGRRHPARAVSADGISCDECGRASRLLDIANRRRTNFAARPDAIAGRTVRDAAVSCAGTETVAGTVRRRLSVVV